MFYYCTSILVALVFTYIAKQVLSIHYSQITVFVLDMICMLYVFEHVMYLLNVYCYPFCTDLSYLEDQVRANILNKKIVQLKRYDWKWARKMTCLMMSAGHPCHLSLVMQFWLHDAWDG